MSDTIRLDGTTVNARDALAPTMMRTKGTR
jgi:hypothetical protein